MNVPYVVLLATAEATIPFVFLADEGVQAPQALEQAVGQWRASAEGIKAEEAYLSWWNTPPMFRPVETVGWEVALTLIPDETLKTHGLERMHVEHCTVEPGESVELSLIGDPPRPVQVSENRTLSVH